MADPNAPTIRSEHRFTNVARIRHTDYEFYLDFAQLVLDQPGVAGEIASLVMTPQHAKSLLRVLADSVSKYEERHGEIAIPAPKEQIKQ